LKKISNVISKDVSLHGPSQERNIEKLSIEFTPSDDLYKSLSRQEKEETEERESQQSFKGPINFFKGKVILPKKKKNPNISRRKQLHKKLISYNTIDRNSQAGDLITINASKYLLNFKKSDISEDFEERILKTYHKENLKVFAGVILNKLLRILIYVSFFSQSSGSFLFLLIINIFIASYSSFLLCYINKIHFHSRRISLSLVFFLIFLLEICCLLESFLEDSPLFSLFGIIDFSINFALLSSLSILKFKTTFILSVLVLISWLILAASAFYRGNIIYYVPIPMQALAIAVYNYHKTKCMIKNYNLSRLLDVKKSQHENLLMHFLPIHVN
jgi:hypothetical protein